MNSRPTLLSLGLCSEALGLAVEVLERSSGVEVNASIFETPQVSDVVATRRLENGSFRCQKEDTLSLLLSHVLLARGRLMT